MHVSHISSRKPFFLVLVLVFPGFMDMWGLSMGFYFYSFFYLIYRYYFFSITIHRHPQ